MTTLSEKQKEIIKTRFYKNYRSCEKEKTENFTTKYNEQIMMFVLIEIMSDTKILEQIDYESNGGINKLINELDLKCKTCGQKLNIHSQVRRVNKYLANDSLLKDKIELPKLAPKKLPQNYRSKITNRPKNPIIENYKKQQLLPKKTQKFKRDRVLVASIDDSRQAVKMMGQIISKQGYNFLGIQNALEALPALITYQPDLIFLDIEMPIFNGYEICHQIKNVSKLKNIPIVILSANNNFPNQLRAKISGVKEFVSKPIEINKIIRILDNHLNPV